jgi:GDP-L-fucose synthase
MNTDSKIFVAGASGLVGSAIVRRLRLLGYHNLLTPTSSDLNLMVQADVSVWFLKNQPEYVFLAAARVGGIWANSRYPGLFIYENLAIQTHMIHTAMYTGVKRLLFLGSSCIYPRDCRQPIIEEALLTGPLEPTNEAYAIAKIAGIKLCEAYRKQYSFDAVCAMPTNLYGPGDSYSRTGSHVIPGLIRRFYDEHKQPTITVWGTGKPRREFMHVDDCAAALVFLMNAADPGIVNVGTGTDVTIRELAEMISTISGFKGRLLFDTSFPDGMPRKLLDVSRLTALGWPGPLINLYAGLTATWQDFLRRNVSSPT